MNSRRLTTLVAGLGTLLVACSPPPKVIPDAGIDTSCGVDCAAQSRYGMILGRCFEYSDTMSAQTTPALSVWVRQLLTLEGNVPVIQADYRQGGQTRMIDSFLFTQGELRHARREFFPVAQSVTYKDDTGKITGVTWLEPTSDDGQHVTTSAKADVSATGGRSSEPTEYKTSFAAANATELNVPLKKYDSGLQMLFDESPNEHGLDGRRVFVPDVGFILFSTSLSLQPGPPVLQYRLQKIRDVATDGGAADCG